MVKKHVNVMFTQGKDWKKLKKKIIMFYLFCVNQLAILSGNKKPR